MNSRLVKLLNKGKSGNFRREKHEKYYYIRYISGDYVCDYHLRDRELVFSKPIGEKLFMEFCSRFGIEPFTYHIDFSKPVPDYMNPDRNYNSCNGDMYVKGMARIYFECSKIYESCIILEEYNECFWDLKAEIITIDIAYECHSDESRANIAAKVLEISKPEICIIGDDSRENFDVVTESGTIKHKGNWEHYVGYYFLNKYKRMTKNARSHISN